MPTLTDLFFTGKRTLKGESPAGLNQRGFEIRFGLTLAELEAFASPRLAVLLTFFHAGIASEKAIGFESRAKIRIHPEERPGDSMPHSPGLSAGAATCDVHRHVELGRTLRDSKGLSGEATKQLSAKIAFQGPAVNSDLAGTGRHANARDRALAPTRA